MFNCEWANNLTRYDCRPLVAVDGSPCLEIGTPFSLPDGSAINLYLKPESQFIRISDNADTMFQLGGLGLDVWNGATHTSLASLTAKNKAHMSSDGEIFLLSTPDSCAQGFAIAIAALLQISAWASERLNQRPQDEDVIALVEPLIIARNPAAEFKRNFRVRGASRSDHIFDFRHGEDAIDVLQPWPQSTGGAMRKAGDVQNGPMSDMIKPLFIVDDRHDPDRAFNEIEILGSITRAMPLTRLMASTMH
ncbi:DUF1828 domain-containing protein (plasmid) [Delftia tsuruhatensis]